MKYFKQKKFKSDIIYTFFHSILRDQKDDLPEAERSTSLFDDDDLDDSSYSEYLNLSIAHYGLIQSKIFLITHFYTLSLELKWFIQ